MAPGSRKQTRQPTRPHNHVPAERLQTIRLTLIDGTVLEGTPFHPIWSVDRNDFIAMADLEEGERLRTTAGPLAIHRIDIRRRPVPVYNIEVRGHHVYQVTAAGILVHNAAECLVQLKKAPGYLPREHDIVRYGQKANWKELGLEKHHAVMNEWAKANVKGYSGGRAPTIVLTLDAHNATRAGFNRWRAANGYSKTAVPWKEISPQEIQKLTYELLAAANVPRSVAREYMREFHQYLYKFM